MKYIIIILSCIMACIAHVNSAVTFIGSSPSGQSFRTTSVVCSVTAAGLTPGGTFYFYHSTTNQFTSSSTVVLTQNTDYARYTSSAVVSYIYNNFNEGSDNWYRWGYKQGATLDESLSVYNVIVTPNQAPVITVVQPDNKGFAGSNTYFEIQLSDEGSGIDESSISFSLADAQGVNVFSFTGNSAQLFDSSAGILRYTCPQALLSGRQYVLTVSAADQGYRAPYALTSSKQVFFNVRDDKIADLIPVPSPFDPGIAHCIIQYTLQSAQDNIEINIYDMSYRLVRTVARNLSRPAGENTLDTWDGKDFAGQSLANGVYFIEVAAGSDKRYSSVILMRK